MRTTTKHLLIGILLATLPAAPAIGQGMPSPATTFVASVVVPSIVRVVAMAGDPANGGIPVVRIISNDPRCRDLTAAPVRAETTPSQTLAFEPTGRSHGGASALEGEVVSSTTTVRYTVALP